MMETKTSDDRMDFLHTSGLWASLSEEALRALVVSMHPMRYKVGQTIIREGETNGHLHVLTAGHAEVQVHTASGTTATVAELRAGDLCGEMSLLTGDPAPADVVAAEESETLMLERRVFNALSTANPNLLREFVRMVSRRLSATVLAVGASREREQDLTRFLLEEKSERYDELVGEPRVIKGLQKQIEEQAKLDTPVLIQGERGTGKELIARRIQYAGSRKDGPLLNVDCAQLCETPWGDQLFGDYSHHETEGTRPNRTCYIELALGGTILLKNIDVLPATIQERLLEFLKAQWQSFGRRPLVRVIATCRRPLSDGEKSGSLIPALIEALSEQVIALSPLRERKRDIPELARHFLRKHAQRLNKRVESLADQALNKLVSYDYLIANVQELEEAIERAVILSDDEIIDPEEVFLGPPPSTRPYGLNLLKLPERIVGTALRAFPSAFRALTALIFAFILYECFFGRERSGGNLGTMLVWSIWWPMLVLSFIFAGRAWCAVCPMAFVGGAMQRITNLERRIPAWLKNYDTYFVMAGFFAIVWIEETTGMRQSPHATGILLLCILSGAVVFSVLFPRRTWCRHVCPLGGFAGLCSTSALMELRPTFDVCSAKCKGHSCYKGDEKVLGCPMFNHVMFIDSNEHCILCMNCVRSCPNASPQLNLRIPARELWANLNTRVEAGRFVAMLAGLLLAQVLVQHWERQPNRLLAHLLAENRIIFVSSLLGLSAGLPLLGLWMAMRSLSKSGNPEATTELLRKVLAWLPLVTAGFLCYQFAFIPGLETLQTTLDYQPFRHGSVHSVSFSALGVLRLGALTVGFALTLGALWKHSQSCNGLAGRYWRRETAVSWAAAAMYWVMLLALML